ETRGAPERISTTAAPSERSEFRAKDAWADPSPVDPRVVMRFEGGETVGLARLREYLWSTDALRHYKETRNGVLEANESSKFSAWLGLGCVSARRIYAEVKRYESERVQNESTYWLIFELLWRDYFKFLALREGARAFMLSGISRRVLSWKGDEAAFDRWAQGQTGYPFVDAFMRELSATGFMSNRGRQNVASFLAKTLGIDWRWGAAHFEAELIDYDAASNWGNWQYVAGVGTDPRDRIFNVVKQGRDYDPDGVFVRRWVPELASVGIEHVHTPWSSGGTSGYPNPIVLPPEPRRASGRPRRRERMRPEMALTAGDNRACRVGA
ncbi:MAG: DASH family cryptochrome, partial [Myxococcales bacterium]|nr:DASH family cryptochrome [Myxococcales bacterium]